VAPPAIDDTVLGTLAALFASTPGFDYQLDRTAGSTTTWSGSVRVTPAPSVH
jgi:hypothetical protein